ncbi:Ankyrin repeat domain-containing protein 46 [Trichoplax sp. H2]|nr:Ankyrin repeat domain-containing protein 46 [Trichoplax sp. H2]|eukprot:RDD43703.1 Ankyrin repeat domain-containing protein 46 [Trichoplax sp. H2]
MLTELIRDEGIQVQTITSLIANHPQEINEKDEYGRTALHIAVSRGRLDLIQCLLENGADPMALDHQGNSPLFFSLKLQSAQFLSNHGADIQHRNLRGDRAVDYVRRLGGRSELIDFLSGYQNEQIATALQGQSWIKLRNRTNQPRVSVLTSISTTIKSVYHHFGLAKLIAIFLFLVVLSLYLAYYITGIWPSKHDLIYHGSRLFNGQSGHHKT